MIKKHGGIIVLSLFFALTLLSFWHLRSDALMDCIKDYRVHLGEHPFGDLWHILKLQMRFSLILIGAALSFAFILAVEIGKKRLFWYLLAVFVLLLLPMKFVWNYYYAGSFSGETQKNHIIRMYEKDKEYQFPITSKYLGTHHSVKREQYK